VRIIFLVLIMFLCDALQRSVLCCWHFGDYCSLHLQGKMVNWLVFIRCLVWILATRL